MPSQCFNILLLPESAMRVNSLSYNNIPTISCDVVKIATSPCIADITFHFLGAKLRKKSQRQKDFPIYLLLDE